MQIISAQQIQSVLDWSGVLDALHRGHAGARPSGGSYFIGDASFGLFSRGVILPGRGAGVKIASIYPANGAAVPPLPSEQAAFLVLDVRTKGLVAMLDGPEITRWKPRPIPRWRPACCAASTARSCWCWARVRLHGR